jgi:hypothetical protein
MLRRAAFALVVGALSADGYNYSDDDLCGFTEPTDNQNSPDPSSVRSLPTADSRGRSFPRRGAR